MSRKSMLSMDLTELENLKTEFAEWRKQKSGRPRIPAELWDKAVSLLGKYSKGRICKTLGLGHSGFVKRLGKEGNVKPESIEQPSFMNIALTNSQADYNCMIEYSNYDGKVLKVHFKAITSAMLCEIVRDYFGESRC